MIAFSGAGLMAWMECSIVMVEEGWKSGEGRVLCKFTNGMCQTFLNPERQTL